MKSLKEYIVIGLIIASVAVFLLFNIQSPEDFYNKSSDNNDLKVTVSIRCDTILSNYNKLDGSLKESGYVPADGVILKNTVIYVKKGSTALDALKEATKQNKIHLEYTQSPNDSYVEGINHIYEFSCGELSGWMYKVNGEFANKGCNAYVLNNSDTIEWVFTCDLGEDVGKLADNEIF